MYLNLSSKDLERFLMLHKTMPIESDLNNRVLIRGILVYYCNVVRIRETVLQSLFKSL